MSVIFQIHSIVLFLLEIFCFILVRSVSNVIGYFLVIV